MLTRNRFFCKKKKRGILTLMGTSCIKYKLNTIKCVFVQFIQQFYNTTYVERYGGPMEDSFLTLLWSLSVSMFPLGGLFGSLMVAPLVNKLGR